MQSAAHSTPRWRGETNAASRLWPHRPWRTTEPVTAWATTSAEAAAPQPGASHRNEEPLEVPA
jgi:hypothetical protein